MFPDPVHPGLPPSATPIRPSGEISGGLDGVDYGTENMHFVLRRERKLIIWHDLFYQSNSTEKKDTLVSTLGKSNLASVRCNLVLQVSPDNGCAAAFLVCGFVYFSAQGFARDI